jgi:hypothetical protein
MSRSDRLAKYNQLLRIEDYSVIPPSTLVVTLSAFCKISIALYLEAIATAVASVALRV